MRAAARRAALFIIARYGEGDLAVFPRDLMKLIAKEVWMTREDPLWMYAGNWWRAMATDGWEGTESIKNRTATLAIVCRALLVGARRIRIQMRRIARGFVWISRIVISGYGWADLERWERIHRIIVYPILYFIGTLNYRWSRRRFCSSFRGFFRHSLCAPLCWLNSPFIIFRFWYTLLSSLAARVAPYFAQIALWAKKAHNLPCRNETLMLSCHLVSVDLWRGLSAHDSSANRRGWGVTLFGFRRLVPTQIWV